MGAQKKPQALRELHGTANRNKHRDNQEQPEVTRGIGPPSNRLTAEQKEIWDEIVGQMYAGVLAEGDRLALELLCRLVLEMRNNFEEMNASKITQLVGLLSRFGMTPSDRTKIIVPKKEESNPFAKFK